MVKELVVRDVNHPSIVMWDNGNEGGWNRGLDNDYALYDPQKRTVIHPWEKFNGTNTKHYPDYDYIVKSVATEEDVFFPTEFMHGLYDGGAGAALDGDIIVETVYEGEGALTAKWTFHSEFPARLNFSYSQTGEVDFTGITFNYPEEKMTGMKWLGRGPYKVWINRLKGQQFGVWHKAYNNSITGETFGYPEFKGYHAEVNWVVIENKEMPGASKQEKPY